MYADDTKMYREIKSEYDHGILQRDLENLKTWADRWLIKFHLSKCYYTLRLGNIMKRNLHNP